MNNEGHVKRMSAAVSAAVAAMVLMLMLLVQTGPVSAAVSGTSSSGAGTIDMSRLAEISILLSCKNDSGTVTDISGAQVLVYKAGELVYSNGSYTCKLTEDFAGSGYSLNGLDTEQAVKTARGLASYAKENSLSCYEQITDSNGSAVFKDLPVGVYLVTQAGGQGVAKKYKPFESFLVTLPANEDGQYVYDLKAQPKTDTIQPYNPSKKTTTKTTTSTKTPKHASLLGKLTKTGDSFDYPLYLGILGIAALTMLCLWILRARDKREAGREK